MKNNWIKCLFLVEVMGPGLVFLHKPEDSDAEIQILSRTVEFLGLILSEFKIISFLFFI